MSRRTTAVLGALGAVAMGIFMKWRRFHPKPVDPLDLLGLPPVHVPGAIVIDDDTAAEIILRARSELERARKS